MNKPFIVGVSGGSGSGKTFFLRSIRNHFKEGEIAFISQDDYYRPKSEQPVDASGWINFDLPECIDQARLLEDLNALLAGETILKKEYTFNVDEENARTLSISPAPIILVEGFFLFHFPQISKLLDLRIFLDADPDVCLARRICRDERERGYDKQKVMYQWVNHVKPAYEKYLLPYKTEADLFILNNGTSEDELFAETLKLSVFLKEKAVLQS